MKRKSKAMTTLKDGTKKKGEEQDGAAPTEVFVKRPRKVKEEVKFSTQMNEEQQHLFSTEGASVLAASRGSRKLLGFHVSAAGGVEQSVFNAVALGCRAFALFVRNQRQWNSKPLDEDSAQRFRKAFKEHYNSSLETVLPHGSYLMNAGTPDAEKLQKTRTALLDECQRCDRLGIMYYNFHPGSATDGCTKKQCMKTVAETCDYVLERTKKVVLVLETMAGQGNTVGGSFEELRDIIDQVKQKDRMGVCIDTCHIFAAGYDIRTRPKYEETMAKFDQFVGFARLKAVHLNDSQGKLGSKLDRHENIGKGLIGKAAFGFIMNDPRFDGIPLILETPEGNYANEMRLLYGMDEATRNIVKKEEAE